MKSKVAITLEELKLIHLDQLVSASVFPNRSAAIQKAVDEAINKLDRTRLARECAKLDISEEKSMAEEGMDVELDEWPTY